MRRIAHLFCQQPAFDRVVTILVFRHRPGPRTRWQSWEPSGAVVGSYRCDGIGSA
jgi:hypothetical protein